MIENIIDRIKAGSGIVIVLAVFVLMIVSLFLLYDPSSILNKDNNPQPSLNLVRPDWVSVDLLDPNNVVKSVSLATVKMDKCYVYLVAINGEIISVRPFDDCLPNTLIMQFASPPVRAPTTAD